MASIGHLLVGAAASKAYRAGQRTRWSVIAAAALWSALSLLPDADVLGFKLGVRYADPWGQRGDALVRLRAGGRRARRAGCAFAVTELVLLSPFLIYALWPRRISSR
jgi:hypothetical protein